MGTKTLPLLQRKRSPTKVVANKTIMAKSAKLSRQKTSDEPNGDKHEKTRVCANFIASSPLDEVQFV